MPTEEDYRFGDLAKAKGLATQERLEECTELLVAYERLASHKRLWDIFEKKAYLTAEQIAELRTSPLPEPPTPAEKSTPVPEQAPGAQPAPPQVQKSTPAQAPPPAPEAEVPLELEDAGAEQRGADGAPEPPPETGLRLIYVVDENEVRSCPIRRKPLSIGLAPGCDVVVSGTGVADRHARVTTSDKGTTIWAMGGSGLVVNERRASAYELNAGDVIQLGSAMLLVAPYLARDESAPEPTSPDAVSGDPVARLVCTDGPCRGQEFYVGAEPLLVGRDPAAHVRSQGPGLARVHARLALVDDGVRVMDLGTSAGVQVNGQSVESRLLQRDDILAIGPFKFRFELLKDVFAGAQRMEHMSTVATGSIAPGDHEARSEWNMPQDVAFRDGGPEQERTAPPAAGPGETDVVDAFSYVPGSVVLVCVEGPEKGKKYPLSEIVNVIGREPGLPVSLPDSSVSRRHAMIAFSQGKADVRDLGSRNGIYVNANHVQSASVRVGDTIRMGKSLLLLDMAQKKA